MSIAMNSPAGWQQIAVFQIHADAPIVERLGSNERDSPHLIIPARESPSGFRRYEIHVDFGIGQLRAIRLAHALIRTLEQSAADGMMPGYHLVSSREWLKLTDLQRGIEWGQGNDSADGGNVVRVDFS
jgi:hypothetical protein